MAPFWRSGAKTPGVDEWVAVIGDEPVLILLDELPSYLQMAQGEPVGATTLGELTIGALERLFNALPRCPRACVVVTNLKDDVYLDGSGQLRTLIENLTKHYDRNAQAITPVQQNTGEVFAIVRKRLFDDLPSADRVDEVAPGFGSRGDELEDHELGGPGRQRSFRPHGSMAHRGEHALDRVRRAQVVPVLGGKVEEGEQGLAILGQAGNRPVVLGAVFVGEPVDRCRRICRASRRSWISRITPARTARTRCIASARTEASASTSSRRSSGCWSCVGRLAYPDARRAARQSGRAEFPRCVGQGRDHDGDTYCDEKNPP